MAEFATTLHYPLREEWSRRSETLSADAPPSRALVGRLLRAARNTPALVLNGFGRADLVAAACLAGWRNPPRVIITDCTWRAGDSALARKARRAAVRAIDGSHVTYCVLSSDELRRFPHTWGVDPERVCVVPWYNGLTEQQLAAESTRDGVVFSGGRSLRDYTPLIEAARELKGVQIRIAAPRSAVRQKLLPAGLVVGEVTHEEYHERMRAASVVVLPLEPRTDRSAGQTTYLDAMAMGKLVIVTETVGVRDYIEDGVTGLVIPPRGAAALLQAISWALDPVNADDVGAISRRAREVARDRFAPDRYVEALLRLACGE